MFDSYHVKTLKIGVTKLLNHTINRVVSLSPKDLSKIVRLLWNAGSDNVVFIAVYTANSVFDPEGPALILPNGSFLIVSILTKVLRIASSTLVPSSTHLTIHSLDVVLPRHAYKLGSLFQTYMKQGPGDHLQ